MRASCTRSARTTPPSSSRPSLRRVKGMARYATGHGSHGQEHLPRPRRWSRLRLLLMPIRRAKLICTLGPAVDSVEKLAELIDAGMDVARFNFSHGSHAEHRTRLENLRAACELKKKPVAVLQDL